MTAARTRRRLRVLQGIARAPGGAGLDLAVRRPRLVAAVAGLAAAAVTGVAVGPVGGVVAAVYAVIAVTYALRRRRELTRARDRSRALDALATLAADLRAGQAPPAGRAAAAPLLDAVPFVRDRVAAAWQVADATGAPLADLLDRLDTDLRGLERVRLAAAAHAAGTRATAGLLAVLPVAGIGVGYGMGADPLHVLLHTPVGAACAGVAVLLQLAGLVWTGRLSRAGGTEP